MVILPSSGVTIPARQFRIVVLPAPEPFSALDKNTKGKIYEEFRAFKDSLKIPTILITHNHREAELFADRNITLKEGRIV